MNNSLPGLLGAVPRKSRANESEAERKAFAEAMGKAIERGILLAGLTKQEVAFAMGYTDASALSRWIAGTETAQFARLFSVSRLQQPLVVALAELTGADVTTHIAIRRSA